jgi:hypothetical protein
MTTTPRVIFKLMSSTYLDRPMRPVTLLPTHQVSDFSRNFLEMEHRAKRPYSLTNVIRSFSMSPYKLDGFEVEVSQELKALNPGRDVTGVLVPIQALTPSRRDLTVTGLPVVVQTTVGDEAVRQLGPAC